MNIKNWSANGRQTQLRTILTAGLGEKTFADLIIPATVMAVDMITGEEIGINEGPLLDAALATSALPAVFPIVESAGKQLADGGVIDSLSTKTAYSLGADAVIAVDLHQTLEVERSWPDPISEVIGIDLPFPRNASAQQPRPLATAWRALRVMALYIHEQRLRSDPATVLLRPEVQSYGSMDFKDIQGPYEAGIREAERQLPAILELKKLQKVV
jgi:NTE family protein